VSNSLGRARDKLDLSTTSQLAVFLDRRTGFRGAPSTEDHRENPAAGHGDGRQDVQEEATREKRASTDKGDV